MSEPRRSRHRRAPSDDTFFKYEPGSICWLKPKNDFADDVEDTELPEGCYNHPAVLLWTEGSGVKATIFIITSFHGTSLEIKHKRSISIRGKHLPISPNPPHPDSGVLLHIDGKPLQCNSWVKAEQTRECSTRALRPHGARKLTAGSYKLLMSYAPAKPPSANIDIIQIHPQQAHPYRLENTTPSVQDRSSRRSHNHSRNRGRRNTTRFAHTQLRHQYYNILRTQQSDHLRPSLLHPHSSTSITPRRTEYTYGTFLPRSQTSHFPAQPSRLPAPPSGGGFPYGKVCGAIVFLGFGGASLFVLVTLGKTLIDMISGWIHNLFSGEVVAAAQFGFRAGKSVGSMTLNRLRA